MAESSTKPLSEAVLRDYLAENLELIEPDLTLVATEHRVKNTQGAAGSIDILARDATNALVVIELKRADSTAREALHEIEKYVALLASDSGVRVDKLRCIVVSTTWHELLVPFARMVDRADFYVTGRLLNLGDDGYPTGSELLDLPRLESGLELCPLHHVLPYATEEGRNSARGRISELLRDLEVTDFITVDLQYTGDNPHIVYPFGHYIALAEFPAALRDYVSTQFPDECTGEFDDVDWWHEQIVLARVVKTARADEVSVASPARFAAMDDYDYQRVAGYGRYGNEVLWTPGQLLGSLKADGETHSMPFQRQVLVANKPAWGRMRSDLARCLEDAGHWPHVILAMLDELESRPSAVVRVYVFAPFDILGGLERWARTGWEDSLPQLIVHWVDGPDRALIGGKLEWNGTTMVNSTAQTLGAVFGNFENYGIARVSGGLAEFETRLCALHGLYYDIGEAASWTGRENLDRVTVTTDGTLSRTPMTDDEPTMEAFAESHAKYLHELVELFQANTLRL